MLIVTTSCERSRLPVSYCSLVYVVTIGTELKNRDLSMYVCAYKERYTY